MDLRARPETAPADLIAVLGSYAMVLARVIDGPAPGACGWHRPGSPTPPGAGPAPATFEAGHEDYKVLATLPGSGFAPVPRQPGRVRLAVRRHHF